MGSTREPLLGRGASTPVVLGRGLEVPLREILAKTPRVRPAGASCALLVGLGTIRGHPPPWLHLSWVRSPRSCSHSWSISCHGAFQWSLEDNWAATREGN